MDSRGASPASRTAAPDGGALPAFAAVGLLAAFFVADALQLGRRAEDLTARGLVTLLVPLGFVTLCLTMAPLAIARATWRDAARPMVCVALLAVAISALLSWLVWPGCFVALLVPVSGGALVALPLGWGLVRLQARGQRARPGSLLFACDERALWLMVDAFALGGASLVSLLPRDVSLGERPLSSSVGFVALVLLPWYAGSSLLALSRLRALARRASSMRRVPQADAAATVVDLGLGSEVLADGPSAAAYRSAPAAHVVIGSVEQVLPLVQRDTRVVLAVSAALVAAQAVAWSQR